MDPFYCAFEDRYRGSRKLIKSRLEIYLPFVNPLKTLYDAPEALDLGCGRGEWLELLQENGFQAKGVDLDEGMLLVCRELKLSVAQADASNYLKGLATDSQNVVSAFHVIEHISFEELRQLVDEALRVLKPGGLLILETPNPENLVVGTSNFYLDPTHQRPLPALLLSFVVEYAGFGRVKTLYLQESPSLATEQKISLFSILAGVSPDYAVVAQKKASVEVCALFDLPFDRSYGVRLSGLAERYDHQAEAQATQAEAQATQAEAQATHAEARATHAEARATHAEAQATHAEARATHAEARATQAEAQATQAEAQSQWLQNQAVAIKMELQAVYASKSWRITLPLRLTMLVAKGVVALSRRAVRWVLRQTLANSALKTRALCGLAQFVLARPSIALPIKKMIMRFPKLVARLRVIRFGALNEKSPIHNRVIENKKKPFVFVDYSAADNLELRVMIANHIDQASTSDLNHVVSGQLSLVAASMMKRPKGQVTQR